MCNRGDQVIAVTSFKADLIWTLSPKEASPGKLVKAGTVPWTPALPAQRLRLPSIPLFSHLAPVQNGRSMLDNYCAMYSQDAVLL